jgi:hypothetical protein
MCKCKYHVYMYARADFVHTHVTVHMHFYTHPMQAYTQTFLHGHMLIPLKRVRISQAQDTN